MSHLNGVYKEETETQYQQFALIHLHQEECFQPLDHCQEEKEDQIMGTIKTS